MLAAVDPAVATLAGVALAGLFGLVRDWLRDRRGALSRHHAEMVERLDGLDESVTDVSERVAGLEGLVAGVLGERLPPARGRRR